MQNFTSWDEVTRWAPQQYLLGGGVMGLIASLSAARCNCSLNNHLSGVASLPFSTGLHSVLSRSEASPTRTVAFLCLPGRLHRPLHQGWLLETFLSQQYIHLMWSRPVSWTLTEAGKQEESPCCWNWRKHHGERAWQQDFFFAAINWKLHTLAPTITHTKRTDMLNHGGTQVLWASVELILSFVSVKCYKHPCQPATLQTDTTLFWLQWKWFFGS